MKKYTLLLLFVFIIIFVKAEAKGTVIKVSENQANADLTLLQNKVTNLDDKIDIINKDLDRILQMSQHTWGHILNIVLTIMAVLLGGSIFNTFFYARGKLNKMEESLRNEIAEKLKEIKNEFEISVDSKFNRMEKNYDTRFDNLESSIYDATGRIYENSSPEVGAIWLMRSIEIFMDSEKYPSLPEKTDTAIRIHMEWVADYLKRGAKLYDPKHIAEFQKVISKIDGNKYRKEKEEIQNALEGNIKKTG